MNQRDLTKERDNRCIPVVHAIFSILADSKLPLGASSAEMGVGKAVEQFSNAAEKIFPLFRTDEAFTGVEVDYVKRLCLEAIEKTFVIVTETTNFKYDLANARKWGLKDSKDIDTVTLKSVEDFLASQGDIAGNSNIIDMPKPKKFSPWQKLLSFFK